MKASYKLEDLKIMTVKGELLPILKKLKISGFSKKTKDEIIDKIMEVTTVGNESGEDRNFQVKTETLSTGFGSEVENTLIQVSCGCSSSTFNNLIGKTVEEVAHLLAQVFGVSSDHFIKNARVDGSQVDADYVLKANDRLEVTKRSGEKG